MDERSKYDMQQAMLMRGRQKSLTVKRAKSSTGAGNGGTNAVVTTTAGRRGGGNSNSNGKGNFTTKQITDELQRLDQAEELSHRGKLKESSALYQDSLGTLIAILGEMKLGHNNNGNDGCAISREVLLERTRLAMADAEAVKEKIASMAATTAARQKQSLKQDKNQGVQVHSRPTKSKTKVEFSAKEKGSRGGGAVTSSGGGGFFGLFKSQSERGKNLNQDLYEPLDLQPSKSADSTFQRTHHRQKLSKPQTPQTTQPLMKKKTPAVSTSPATLKKSPKPNTTKRRSNLDYKTNDPLITTIKKDMYVDSKTLTTTWNDITGLREPKQALQEAAILPLLRPDLYTGLRSPPRGILLYGPPGTGKTMLVRAVAHESQCILFACSASSMTSKWVGEGEKLVRTLFRMAADVAPSIVFLDEMDALLGRRRSDGNSEQESSRRFKTEFMVQMDGIAAGSGNVMNGGGGNGNINGNNKEELRRQHEESLKNRILLIGCTNCPWDIDDAVMRRFQRRIYVPLPDTDARRTLWKKLIGKSKDSISMSTRDVERLVTMSQGFSCSDISSIANEAAFGPLRELGSIDAIKDVKRNAVRPIKMKDFESAIRNAKKSVSDDLLKRYDAWEETQAAGR